MAAPDLTALVSKIEFGTISLALLGVFASLIVVEIVRKGVSLVTMSVRGDKVIYHGRAFDIDVWNTTMEKLEVYKKAGGQMDKESATALRAWQNDRAKFKAGL